MNSSACTGSLQGQRQLRCEAAVKLLPDPTDGVGETASKVPYMVLEWLPGQSSLANRLRKHGLLWGEAAELVRQVAGALARRTSDPSRGNSWTA